MMYILVHMTQHIILLLNMYKQFESTSLMVCLNEISRKYIYDLCFPDIFELCQVVHSIQTPYAEAHPWALAIYKHFNRITEYCSPSPYNLNI